MALPNKSRPEECRFSVTETATIQTLVLENGLLRVEVFAGKGAEIHKITYLPKSIQFLLEIPEALPVYQELDLSKQPLQHYGQHGTGGWQDVVPGLGVYAQERIEADRSGIAATLPWQYRLVEQTPQRVAVLLFVDLPTMPLRIEKQIALYGGKPGVEVIEKITNLGEVQAKFTWTQHIALGGGFVEPGVQVDFPGELLYCASRHTLEGGAREDFEFPVSQMRMPDGTSCDLRSLPPRSPEQWSMVATQNHLKWDFYTLYNARLDMGLRLEWDANVYPFLRCWMQSGPSAYSLALEPSNYACHHQLNEVLKHRQYRQLLPGEAVRTKLSLQVLDGCVECP